MMLPWQKRPLALNSPRDLPGLALWLDSKDVSSLRNDAGAQPVTTDGIKLASDKSGNSSTNVLCLDGVSGNYASASDSVPLSITEDIDLRERVALDDWTPAAFMMLLAKDTSGQRSYTFGVQATTGLLVVGYSTDGVNLVELTSSVAPTVSDYGALWVRVTLDVDNGAAGKTATFYTGGSGETPTWVQLGTTQTTAGTITIADTTSVLQIGSNFLTSNRLKGVVYRAQVYAGLTGSDLRFDANFATAAKLATSFTESSSNAATVTINTSGATGARISGARDLYQGTAANQPILTIAAAGNYLTFDGSNDYLKAAAFALAQPETVYFVGSQVTWTNGDNFFEGGSASAAMFQNGVTPNIGINAGSTIGNITTLALNTYGVLSAVFNGASSSYRLNRLAAGAGNAGANNPNGFTLGSNTAGAGAFANITAQEVLVYSGAHDKATQDRVIAYLANRNRIALT